MFSVPPPSQPRAVPFGALPGPQPGHLSFGFGLSHASNLNAHPHRSASPSAFPSTALLPSHLQHPHHPPALSPHSRRRRRSATPDTDGDDEAPPPSPSSAGPPPQPRTLARTSGKKARLDHPDPAPSAPRPLQHHPLGTAAPGTVDLAKALSNLTQPALVSLLTALLSANPALRPTIEALLPPPTLPDTLAQLATLERAVLAALPTGTGSRPDYVWGRVRAPLEAYCVDAKALAVAFSTPPSPASSQSSHPSHQSHSSHPTPTDDLHHPATTFAFLHALTLSLARLSAALPAAHPPASPLAAHLQLVLQAWDALFKKVHGRVLSRELVQGWFARADALVDAPGEVAERVGVPVRDRLRSELGWLVGWKEPASGEAMEEEL